MNSSSTTLDTEFLRTFNGEASLDRLAARIREAHAATQEAAANALAAIFVAGEALIAARFQVPEGTWQHWLSTHCSLSLSTAKLYIQITEHRAKIEPALKDDPHLSLRAARQLIAKPKGSAKHSTQTDNPPARKPAKARNLTRRRIYREMKLGENTLARLQGTSLDSAAEQKELIMLNRGAEPGTLTPVVQQLVDDAVAGRNVSAFSVRGVDLGLQAQVSELQNQVRLRDIRIHALEGELGDLKATDTQPFDLVAIWENATAGELSAALNHIGCETVLQAMHLSAGRLVDLFESELARHGIDAAVQLRKVRDCINRMPPKTIDVKALPAAEEAA